MTDSLELLSLSSLYHGDLHAGNVFLVERDGMKRAVIGDFGETRFSSAPTRHLTDLYFLFTSLKEILKNRGYYPIIDKLLKFVSIQSGVTEKEFEQRISSLPEEFQYYQEDQVPEEVNNIMNDLISRDINMVKQMLK